jgi:hypothetical protein|tara:strand:- start:880 stop:1293 length:414 start_codon:yes stop_codon:yes gene_type:complete
MSFKHLLYAICITAVVLFAFVKSVEAQPHNVVDTDPELLVIATELEDKEMAVMVLGGIDYYVQECTPLTSRGIIYKAKIITYHTINKTLLPINPTYIKGALAVSGYNCQEMFDLIEQLESGVVEEPTHPVDKQQSIS